jgi:hypothetical protein
MPLPFPRRPHAAILAALLCVACGNPTAPDAPLIVRLTLSPPAIQATPDGDGWRATWTVNLDAASEFPPDSHGVLLEIAAPFASVTEVRAEVRGSGGSLLAEFTTTAAAIGAANGGSTALTADGPAIQVTQEASYGTTTAPPSQSQLTVVATLRDARGVERPLTTTSVVAEATCGGRGLPPCGAD